MEPDYNMLGRNRCD